MALLTPKNWSLNSYTNAEWTPLVDEPAVVASMTVCNITGAAVNIEVRVYDTSGEVARATILPTAALAAGSAVALDLKSLVLTADQELQVRMDAAGAEWFASGAVQ